MDNLARFDGSSKPEKKGLLAYLSKNLLVIVNSLLIISFFAVMGYAIIIILRA
ncbi:hypothetical protein IJI55_02135 [Candidatus Saccharibacteria bacterium]|nr:hypothetical protein [Candidatus Saccharibacteria bacterium]